MKPVIPAKEMERNLVHLQKLAQNVREEGKFGKPDKPSWDPWSR
jgi:hypothetical protein